MIISKLINMFFHHIQVDIKRTGWENIRNSPHQTVYLSVFIMQMITLVETPDDVTALLRVFDFVNLCHI